MKGLKGITSGKLAFFAILTAVVFCFGCGSSQPAETTAAAETTVKETETETETEAETEVETEAAAEVIDDEEPPEEGMVRSLITNEWVTPEIAEKRPIAVMYPIDKAAQPQYGISRASIFYEIMEEGSMTRQMGILEDWEDLSRIGNIRSTRNYFIYEMLEWDSVLVHFGGPEIFVKEMLTRNDVENINGVSGVMGPDYGAFYRIPAGSRSTHTAYTDAEHVLKAFEKGNFQRTHREGLWKTDRWHFAPASHPVTLDGRKDAVSAEKIDMKGCYPITGSAFEYHAEDGKYYRSIYGAPQKDAINGQQLCFDNIIVEAVNMGNIGTSEYLWYNVLDSGHKGYYMTRGKMIPIMWEKAGEYEVSRFYDMDGNEITLNTGKTMMCIARDGKDSFLADGEKYTL